MEKRPSNLFHQGTFINRTDWRADPHPAPQVLELMNPTIGRLSVNFSRLYYVRSKEVIIGLAMFPTIFIL